jgi:hypothetical protein
LDGLADHPSLRTLDFKHAGLTPTCLAHGGFCGPLLDNPRISHLDLSGNNLAAQTHETQSGAYGTSGTVYIKHKTVGDGAGLIALAAAVQRGQGLATVDLSDTYLKESSSAACTLLEALAKLPSVQKVKLSGNRWPKTSKDNICEAWVTKTLGARAEGHTAEKRMSYGEW